MKYTKIINRLKEIADRAWTEDRPESFVLNLELEAMLRECPLVWSDWAMRYVAEESRHVYL